MGERDRKNLWKLESVARRSFYDSTRFERQSDRSREAEETKSAAKSETAPDQIRKRSQIAIQASSKGVAIV